MNFSPYRTPRILSKRHRCISLKDTSKETIKHITNTKTESIHSTLNEWSEEAKNNKNKWIKRHFVGELLKLQTEIDEIIKDLKE